MALVTTTGECPSTIIRGTRASRSAVLPEPTAARIPGALRCLMRRHWRRSVRRLKAERYMRWMLVAFAAMVLGVRAYPALTGYPQVGRR